MDRKRPVAGMAQAEEDKRSVPGARILRAMVAQGRECRRGFGSVSKLPAAVSRLSWQVVSLSIP